MDSKTIRVLNSKVTIKISGQGYPVLLLHGWSKDQDYFNELREKLAKKGNYKIYSFDWPGFGKSAKVLRQAWNLDDYANFLQQIVLELHLSKYSIVAHSFGGNVLLKTLILGMINPEKIILCSSSGIRTPKSVKKRIFKVVAKSGKSFFKLPILNKAENFFKRLLYKISGNSDYNKTDNPILKKTFINIVQEDLRDKLDGIATPILLLWGKNDTYTPISQGNILHSKLINSQFKIVEDSDHALLRKKPDQAASIIADYLK